MKYTEYKNHPQIGIIQVYFIIVKYIVLFQNKYLLSTKSVNISTRKNYALFNISRSQSKIFLE